MDQVPTVRKWPKAGVPDCAHEYLIRPLRRV